ncbi:MAG: hypothetical protein V4505_25655 [Pseudomonadota bacterium]
MAETKEKMTEEDLKAITDSAMSQAIGLYGGKLADQRQKAERYYLAEAVGDLAPPEVEGRSRVVSPDVRNTIEAMLPQLMVKFTGGDTVVEFEPTLPGDEEKASLCTDYLNYLFFKKNNGHDVTLTWFKDALLQKRGIVKVWWDTRVVETREEYRALSDVELAQILEDKELTPIEAKNYPDEDDAKHRQEAMQQLAQQLAQAQQAAAQPGPQQQQATEAAQQVAQHMQQIQAQPPVMLHDITVKRTKTNGKICVENVPPEEFLISRIAKSINDAPFVGHRLRRTVSDLKSMGYKNVDNLTSDDVAASLNAEAVERYSWDDDGPMYTDQNTLDASQRQVWLTECYIRVDWDGDGISELRKVVRSGNEILENEVVDVVPFASICPVPMPHKFFGLSIADLGFEGQKTRTSILRASLDNMYLEANGRYFAVENQVNLDDLLVSRPGGIVRVKAPGMVGRLDQGKGNTSDTMGMLEYMHTFLEDSTGWSRASQGTDANGLHQTATQANIVTNKADMRLDLIARNFAEGFVDMFRLMLKLVCQYQDRKTEVRLHGEFVDIDPREWYNEFDVSINVGLGMGNKDQQVAHLGMLGAHQAQTLQIGVATPENVYKLSLKLAQALGFKHGDEFFTDPVKNPMPKQPNPEMLKLQMQGQVEQAKLKQGAELERMKLDYQAKAGEMQRNQEAQLEALRQQMQQATDQNRQQLEAQQQALKAQGEAQMHALEQQYKNEQHGQQMMFQRWKAELEAATKIEVANVMSKAKVADAATAAATNEIAQEVQQ